MVDFRRPGHKYSVNYDRVEIGSGIWVMFCLSQTSLTRFIKYPGLTWIQHCTMCITKCICPDQSNELSKLDGDDESISPDFPQDMLREWNNCTIKAFDLSVLG